MQQNYAYFHQDDWKLPSQNLPLSEALKFYELAKKRYHDYNAKLIPNTVKVEEAPRAPSVKAVTNYQELITKHSPPLVEGSSTMLDDVLIPEIDPLYQPFGFFNNLLKIVESQKFFPIMITGDSGYGKTIMVEQVCAVLKRKLIRVPISSESDKAALLVVPTLVNGTLTYENGPVLDAMEQGAVLLLDEVDRGTTKLICMQGIMEGKPYYNEKTQKLVKPAPGFTVIATANSKGQGMGTKYLVNILDAAFLERFPITVIQNPPSEEEETIIIKNKLTSLQIDNTSFVKCLVRWANLTRETEKEGGIDESISTRRLINICDAFKIFDDKITAIQHCINRFPDDIINALLDFYRKIDEEVSNKETLDKGIINIWEEESP